MDRITGKNSNGLPYYYWLIGGLLVGILIGWFFHGFINMLLRMALIFGLFVVAFLIFKLWRKASSDPDPQRSDIPEGSWRDIDPSGRR